MDRQWKEDYMFFQLSKMIELKKKGKTIDFSRMNKGPNPEEAVQDAKARQVTVIRKDQWYMLKCRQRKVRLATDWNIPTCYKELPVWVEPDGEHSNIRFLSLGSRLLLNHSQPESCCAHSERPQGYQTTAGDWMTLNPRVQQLSSRVEEDEDLSLTKSELAAGDWLSGSPIVRRLHKWAESHQGRFGMKSTQHGLLETDMGIIHGETLQAGSDNKEYREFLNKLEARAFRTRASEEETGDTLPIWTIQLGIGCAILSMCWVGGQWCYKGFQII